MLKIDNLSNEIEMTAVRGGSNFGLQFAGGNNAYVGGSGNSLGSPTTIVQLGATQTMSQYDVHPVTITTTDVSNETSNAWAMQGVAIAK